ncbi:MAG: hypothetical protein OH318_01450 [Candidatus Parvarchaeota archaeon]|nr:hypothetical protein [Candidatus Rehaiarchaeum fermentans]MCW1293038.1 hypothetical protein [Candidatus Rehaiarchaeum fermentans]MCW1293626.1 hypothetical protein [Candidatus Rehaiarchaeum fermentans]
MGIVHTLARNGTFIFRFNDGEFGSKWCGIWKEKTKYFDYFAFKFNDEWLSSKNLGKFYYNNSMNAEFEYNLNDIKIKESVYALTNGILVRIISNKPGYLSLEYGVNIRDRIENYQESKRYETKIGESTVSSTINNRSAIVFFPKNSEIQRIENYDVHIPGLYAKEKGFSHYFDDLSVQNKYVPVNIKTKINPENAVEFYFGFNPSLKPDINEYNNYLEELARYKELAKLEDAISMYANYNEGKIYAGFPYFNEFWLRDALVSIPAFLSLNKFEFVKKVLGRISEMEKDGKLPNVEGGNIYPADVPALYLIMMHSYFEETNDRSFIQRYFSRIKSIAEYWRNVAINNNWIINDKGRETWMDSIDRENSLEIQALWSIAFKKASELYWQVGERNSLVLKAGIAMEDSLYRYEKNEYFKDQLEKDINSINQVILFFTDISKDKKEKIARNLLMNFSTNYGLTSLSKNDELFDFNGYHTGAIWPLMTLLAGIGMIKNNIFNEEGKKLIKIVQSKIGLQAENSINEIIRPDGKPEGCPSQLWSIAPLLFKLK